MSVLSVHFGLPQVYPPESLDDGDRQRIRMLAMPDCNTTQIGDCFYCFRSRQFYCCTVALRYIYIIYTWYIYVYRNTPPASIVTQYDVLTWYTAVLTWYNAVLTWYTAVLTWYTAVLTWYTAVYVFGKPTFLAPTYSNYSNYSNH